MWESGLTAVRLKWDPPIHQDRKAVTATTYLLAHPLYLHHVLLPLAALLHLWHHKT